MLSIHNIGVEKRNNSTIVTLSTSDNEKIVMTKDGDEWMTCSEVTDIRRYIPIVETFLKHRQS